MVIRWHGSALDGLRALVEKGDYEGRFQNEIERLQQGDNTPKGWYHLWNIGPSEIYRDGFIEATKNSAKDSNVNESGGEHKHCIHCHTRGNTGILQYDVDLPFTEDTELSWSWCVKALPSSIREDSLPSHDYLSIAVEFDNGRDITYYWSSTLAVETGYDCPLPNWAGKEFHVVVRSGNEGLGSWLDERRNLHRDYQHYMGEPPGKIVKVWLIANSILQRGTGICDYANIALGNAENDIQIL